MGIYDIWLAMSKYMALRMQGNGDTRTDGRSLLKMKGLPY